MGEKKKKKFSSLHLHQKALLLLLLLKMSSLVVSSSSPSSSSGSLETDRSALLELKAACDSFRRLTSWNSSDPSPCASWHGVTCVGGRVTRLVLEGLSLAGPACFPAVTRLDQLRVLSLKSNSLASPIPDLSSLSALKLLFLSHNQLYGPIPPSISSLVRLYRLDLASNNLTGSIPASLARLGRLLTLRLDRNRLSGSIPGLVLPRLQDLNVSSNLLSGAVPPSFAAFPAAVFAGNPALCGEPLFPCRPTAGAVDTVSPAALASAPHAKPEFVNPRQTAGGVNRQGMKMNRVVVVAIVVGDFTVIILVCGLLFCYFWRKFARRVPLSVREGEKIVYSSPYASSHVSAAGTTTGGGFQSQRGKMIFFEGTKQFLLEDLLRASAEILGKGGYGTAYRAVLDDGTVVAVKRLRETHKRDLENQLEILGQLRHPNLVSLKAYYYARDEKLLVYEYMPNGSVFFLLHGNRGPGRMPLDWASRVRIAVGAARGLAFLHQGATRSPKLAHGNIKSTNILLDNAGNARLSDAGLSSLGPASTACRTGGYRPPEAPVDRRRSWASQRADVYAFGVVLLELLTGKPAVVVGDGVVEGADLPGWVRSVVQEEWTSEVFDLELMRYKGIEGEMVAMLQIAVSCTVVAADQRPKIGTVVNMLEEIRSGGVFSPSHNSASDSASASASA